MSNRIYKFIALGILVVAPIIAQILSTALPVAQQPVEATTTTAPPETASAEAAAPPIPQPAPPQQAPSSDALVDAAPTLNPQGIDPAAAIGQEFAAASPPASEQQPQSSEENGETNEAPPAE